MKNSNSKSRVLIASALLTATSLFAASCGSSGSEGGEATDTTAAPTTAAPATDAPADDAPASGATAQVTLAEWSLETAPADLEAGTIEFTVVNDGDFGHEFAIARGDSYDALPKLGNGAVDEDAAGADFIGRTETFGSGETITATFELEPGTYVFMCNIQAGPNSHAAAGQVQTVVVG